MGSSWRSVCIKEALISFLMAGITACFYADGSDSVGRKVWKKQERAEIIARTEP